MAKNKLQFDEAKTKFVLIGKPPHLNKIENLAIEIKQDKIVLSGIRNYLSLDVTVTLMVSLVLSRLDHGNAMLSGLSLGQLCKLQKVRNHAAEVIFKKKKK